MWRVGASREGLPSEQGTDHKFRDFLQWYGLQRLLHRSSSKRFCAGHSRDNSRADDSRNESHVDDDSRNEPSSDVDSRNLLCVEGDFQRDDKTFLGVRKDDVTFLDVQTVGVTLPVPGSSSSFSSGSVVVVGSRENQCQDGNWKSGGGAEHNMSEHVDRRNWMVESSQRLCLTVFSIR